jgi:hypothetical protein
MAGIIVTIPPTVGVPPGNNASNPSSLPPITYTYAILNIPQTWTGAQTFNKNTFLLAGSTSGTLTINAAAVASGTITLPSGTIDVSGTGGAHQVVQQSAAGGPFTVGQLAFSDISGTASATQLPNPTPTTLGGIKSIAATASKWINSIGTDGTPTQAQPAASDISGLAASATTDTTNAINITSGTLPAGRLPTPTASTLGGVKSLAAVSHQFLTQIGTDGSVSQAQPAFSDISGIASTAQLPNFTL